MPVRRIPKNHRSLTGFVTATKRAGQGTEGGMADFESNLERDLLTLLAFEPESSASILDKACANRACSHPVTGCINGKEPFDKLLILTSARSKQFPWGAWKIKNFSGQRAGFLREVPESLLELCMLNNAIMQRAKSRVLAAFSVQITRTRRESEFPPGS
jgi:hypothetical protein